MAKKRQANPKRGIPIFSYNDPVSWLNLAFYFLFFSFIGHYIEMGWNLLCHLILRQPVAHNILANPFEPYTIYGVGAVLCILIVYPLVKKLNHHPLATFAVATIVCATLELLSSTVLTARYGTNPYWNYDGRFMNLGGHICLGNSLLFGLLATIFLYFLLPPLDRILRKAPKYVTFLLIAVLLVLFALYYLQNP